MPARSELVRDGCYGSSEIGNNGPEAAHAAQLTP